MTAWRQLLAPLSPLYKAAITSRNRRFDAGRGVVTFDRPVVSVGNLSTGGTGKTPLTMWLIRQLRDAGHWPCVAMRGYGAPAGKGNESDEAREYRAAFPDLPLVAQPDRTKGLLELLATELGERVDAVVLDDGFQHRQIARQLDIVTMDATRSAFEDALLPAGNLREPFDSLSRAHVVVLTHAQFASDQSIRQISVQVRRVREDACICVCEHAWETLVDQAGVTHPVQWLRGKRLFAACAIGNPDAFLAGVVGAATGTLRQPPSSDGQYHDSLVGRMVLRDHDPYETSTISRLLSQARSSQADAIVVTEKDWSKLQRVKPDAWPVPVLRPRLALRFSEGEAQLRDVVRGVAAAKVE